MKKWYKEPYFNRRVWLLENVEKLNINSEEFAVVLLIDYAKEMGITVGYDYLTKKLNTDEKSVDRVISSLVEKQYLKIKTSAKGISFSIDGIFEFDLNAYEIAENKDIYDILAESFNRPLNPTELQKASDLINEFGQNKFDDALRTAEAYRKVNMAYIESVLRNAKNK